MIVCLCRNRLFPLSSPPLNPELLSIVIFGPFQLAVKDQLADLFSQSNNWNIYVNFGS